VSNKKFPISDHCDGTRFFNSTGEIAKTFKDILKWKMNNKRKVWPKWVENKAKPNIATSTSENEIVLTFINHVTFLIQTAGLNILTDPVFSKRTSPLQWIGPQRVRDPGIALKDLPAIDIVLVSHNHYDHLDFDSIKYLSQKFQPHFVTPLGNGDLLRKAGAQNVTETDWWDTTEIFHIRILTVPAHHWSSRTPYDRNLALWSGFIVQTMKNKIYFAGDTGYGKHFKEIREKIGTMDVSLLPIGAYEPRWFMREQHMNPDDAVLAHQDLETNLSIGTHFGAFQLTDEGIDEPVKDLEVAIKKYNAQNFIVMEVGETKYL